MDSKIVETVAKLLPAAEIYNDGAKPAVRQLGKLTEDLMKVLRLVLFPVQVAAVFQDKVEALLSESVRRIPRERLISPPPQILGPVLEAIRYEPLDSSVGKMFADLLSSSMDVESVTKAHPAYPLIIRQLSSDEALILKMLSEREYEYVARSFLTSERRFQLEAIEIDELPRMGLTSPDRVGSCISHLTQLGLAGIYEYKNQEPILASDTGEQTGTRVFSRYRLTSFGSDFMSACTYGSSSNDLGDA